MISLEGGFDFAIHVIGLNNDRVSSNGLWSRGLEPDAVVSLGIYARPGYSVFLS